MQTTIFPVHEAALSTPEDDDIISGDATPLGTLIFTWGLRDVELRLISPLHRFIAEGVDPDAMIGLGQQLVEEGERLKNMASRAESAIIIPEIELPAATAMRSPS